MTKQIVSKKVMLWLAIACMLFLPGVKVSADVVALPAPKDAMQTVSTETGAKVSWSKVNGAKSYVYSISADGKTFSQETLTGNNGTDTFVNYIDEKWTPGTDRVMKIRAYDGSKYSDAVLVKMASAPKAPLTLKQTAAETGSISLSWTASQGATGYLIRFGTTKETAKDFQTVKTTACKITGLKADTAYYVAIYPIRAVSSKFYASFGCTEHFKVVTTADAVTGLTLAEWDVKANFVQVKWTNTAKYETGYEIEILSADGTKSIKKYEAVGRRTKSKYFATKKIKNKPFLYRVRTFTTLSGVKSYGAWSEAALAVPQANVKAVKAGNTSVKLTWDQIENATTYVVYRGTVDGGKFKKIGTTKKNEFIVKDLKENTDYFFYVKAKTKIGLKKADSNKVETTNDINVFICRNQDTVTE